MFFLKTEIALKVPIKVQVTNLFFCLCIPSSLSIVVAGGQSKQYRGSSCNVVAVFLKLSNN